MNEQRYLVENYRTEYASWNATRHRCRNPKTTGYKDYGARGIDMCEAWFNSFHQFMTDMGPKPSKGMVLARRDMTKGYDADNCLWADRLYTVHHPDRRPRWPKEPS